MKGLKVNNVLLGSCTPYSREACMAAALSQGLKQGGAGSEFVGDWSTKGCYAYKSGTYAGIAFYGTGGSKEQMREPLTSDKIFRPTGHDCPAGNQ